MAYKRVVLTEKDNMIKSSVDANNNTTNEQVYKQMSKFDSSYTSKKLKELYHEFDSITFTGTNTSDNATISESVDYATKTKLNYKTKLYLSSAIIVVAMLLFLAIFNIFVINNLNAGIKLLQEEVTVSSANYENVYAEYKKLKNVDNITENITQNGFGEISSGSVIKITPLTKQSEQSISVDSNWFDAFCEFVGGLFGG